MRNCWLIIILLGGFFLMAGCNNNSEVVIKHKDSIQDKKQPEKEADEVDTTNYESCYEDFFKGLPRFNDSASAYLILGNGKRKSLTQFFKDEFMSPVSQYGIKDLDADGVKELIIFNYTGGPHCCDDYYIFRQKNEREFELKAHIMGGQACIDTATNIIGYSFSELLGYFFSCYACGFADSTGTFKTLREIHLKYSNARLQVITYDSILENQNPANLEVLQKHGYEKVEDMMDSGWRKEFAMNFAVWHYNHGKNWRQTKKLFQTYYTFQDAPKFWKEFYRTMMDAGKDNSF